MLPSKSSIIDYQIVPANEVPYYLAKGFTLYGTPISHLSHHSTQKFYQALIKTQHSEPNSAEKVYFHKITLSDIEQRCVALIAEGKTPEEIAQAIHRSTRRVRTLITELRYRLGCKTSAQMILFLERQGLLARP